MRWFSSIFSIFFLTGKKTVTSDPNSTLWLDTHTHTRKVLILFLHFQKWGIEAQSLCFQEEDQTSGLVGIFTLLSSQWVFHFQWLWSLMGCMRREMEVREWTKRNSCWHVSHSYTQIQTTAEKNPLRTVRRACTWWLWQAAWSQSQSGVKHRNQTHQETDREVYRKERIGVMGEERKCKEEGRERGRESGSSPLNQRNSGFSQKRNFLCLHVKLSVFLAHRAAAWADGGSDEHTPELRLLQAPGTQNGLQRFWPPTSGQKRKLL